MPDSSAALTETFAIPGPALLTIVELEMRASASSKIVLTASMPAPPAPVPLPVPTPTDTVSAMIRSCGGSILSIDASVSAPSVAMPLDASTVSVPEVIVSVEWSILAMVLLASESWPTTLTAIANPTPVAPPTPAPPASATSSEPSDALTVTSPETVAFVFETWASVVFWMELTEICPVTASPFLPVAPAAPAVRAPMYPPRLARTSSEPSVTSTAPSTNAWVVPVTMLMPIDPAMPVLLPFLLPLEIASAPALLERIV